MFNFNLFFFIFNFICLFFSLTSLFEHTWFYIYIWLLFICKFSKFLIFSKLSKFSFFTLDIFFLHFRSLSFLLIAIIITRLIWYFNYILIRFWVTFFTTRFIQSWKRIFAFWTLNRQIFFFEFWFICTFLFWLTIIKNFFLFFYYFLNAFIIFFFFNFLYLFCGNWWILFIKVKFTLIFSSSQFFWLNYWFWTYWFFIWTFWLLWLFRLLIFIVWYCPFFSFCYRYFICSWAHFYLYLNCGKYF